MRLLTIREAAELAGVSRQAIEQAIARGILPAETVQVDATRLRRADVLRYARRTGGKVGRPITRPPCTG